jgi:hypothetical protein
VRYLLDQVNEVLLACFSFHFLLKSVFVIYSTDTGPILLV